MCILASPIRELSPNDLIQFPVGRTLSTFWGFQTSQNKLAITLPYDLRAQTGIYLFPIKW